jgi:hypothetical protein
MKEKNPNVTKLKSHKVEIEEITLGPEPVKRVLIIKNCVLSLGMPGHSGGKITKSFREGQIIYDPCSIEQLLLHNMPVEILG